jgi:hypothetical protein
MRQLPCVSEDPSTEREEYISVIYFLFFFRLLTLPAMHVKSVQKKLPEIDAERRGRVLSCGALPGITLSKEHHEKNTK